MKNEIEAKFTNVNIDEIRQKLAVAGGVLIHPMRDFKRVTIDSPELKAKDAFVRVRDEGNKTTLTYKQFDKLSLDGVKEIEVVVSDFDTTVDLFRAVGLPHGSLQESRRETWELDDAEVVIDQWPWLNTYIEIEGPTEDSVINTAKKLGFEWEEAIFGDVMAAYRVQYPHLTLKDTVGNLENVRFDDPLPDMFKN
ncbi:MAG: class IV adenylate cyclase [Candidatus Microsaccharimonas sp.]